MTGTPVNFSGMTGRALAVILKYFFENRAIIKKNYWPPKLQLYGPSYIYTIIIMPIALHFQFVIFEVISSNV
jgi:hypothetical protein